MTPAARLPRPRLRQRAVQAVTAGTAVVLAAALAVGAAQSGDQSGDQSGAGAVVVAGHHGGTALAPAVAGVAAGSDVDAAAPATRDPHDHGELEVTVMLAVDGQTRVQGPVEPGAFFSFVNHTEADQLLTTPDGALTADVPLRRLVTVQAPQAPGTYRLVSTTDPTVSAELVVERPSA